MTTDVTVALVRQAIFTVLDEREWDFTNDEHRVDFADFVMSFLPPLEGRLCAYTGGRCQRDHCAQQGECEAYARISLTDEEIAAVGAAVPAGRGYSERRDRAIAEAFAKPSETGAPKGFILVPEKPVAWRREWDGDDSDIGAWVYDEERPSDGYIWQALYAVEPQ